MKSQAIYVSFSPMTWLLMFLIVWFAGMLSENMELTIAALLCVPVLATLLWRVGEPPVLFLAVMMQWLQVSISVFDANFRFLSVQDYFSGWYADETIWLSLTGLLVLSLGIRIALYRFEIRGNVEFSDEVKSLSIPKIWYAYIGFILFSFVLGLIAWRFPRFYQIILALLSFKWVLFFLLAVTVLGQRRHLNLLVGAVLIEIFIGFTGFFAVFKQVFFVLLLVFLTFIREFKGKAIAVSILTICILFNLLVIWTAIKNEYRDYVSQGTGKQVILVSAESQFQKLGELIVEIDKDRYLSGLEQLVNRVAYVDYFIRVRERVPSLIPFENGELWLSALQHILTPRIFFPDKGYLTSDTLLTEKYTGYYLALPGINDTSIPMGYMTESYIDFGPIFMFFPIILVGIAWGLIYRYLLSAGNDPVFSYGIAVAVLINANSFEITSVKLLGSILMGFITLALLQKFIVPEIKRAFVSDQPEAANQTLLKES